MAQFYDTMLAEYIAQPGQKVGLDSLALRHFNYEMMSYESVTQKKKLSFEEVDLTLAAKYSGEDVYMTYLLYKEQQDKKYRQESIEGVKRDFDVLNDIEFPLMHVLSRMEMHGITIDRDILKGIGIQLEQALGELKGEIYALAGEEFNINSPKQVGYILFERLGYKASKKTKTGYSVNSEVLEGLAQHAPIAKKIIEYRHYAKLLSTYVEGLLAEADENDRIHTSYNQTVTTTGRLSSNNPNLQNIPAGDGLAGEIRAAFIPNNPGDEIIAFDYSQVEVRLLAIMSADNNLLAAFSQGRDIHQVTGEFIFGEKDISGTQRRFAKAVNFGVIYGISPFGLSKMIDISQKEAKNYIDAFYTLYPKVREFFDSTIENCKKTGYVETLFGRKRYIANINDQNKMIQQSAQREAINMPIQGTSADIIKIAMLRIDSFLEKNNCKSVMLLQVHDELVFNIVPEERDILTQKIPEIMETVLKDIPIELKVDMAAGKNWKEAK